MKKTQLMLLGGAMASFLACESKSPSQEKYEDRMDHLEDFVDSVETAVNRHDSHDWSRLDSRYNRLTSQVKELEAEVSDPDYDDWREITERYDKAKRKSMDQTKIEMETEAEAHLDKVETWWDQNKVKAERKADNTGSDIEKSAEESLAWLEENFERLGDSIKERYRKVKADIES